MLKVETFMQFGGLGIAALTLWIAYKLMDKHFGALVTKLDNTNVELKEIIEMVAKDHSIQIEKLTDIQTRLSDIEIPIPKKRRR